MKFNICTVFNRIDGFSSELFVCRSEKTFVREFVQNFENQNEQLKAKKMPQNRLSDFEIKIVGTYDDETCHIIPQEPVVIPFNSVEEET